MDVSSGDYYRRLRLSRTASTQEIKSAFRRLARLYHPDLHPHQPDAARKFQALREAYEVLSDRIRRQNYDRRYHERTSQADYFSPSFPESFVEPRDATNYERTPQTPDDFYIRGIQQALAHRYSAALEDYSQAIALDPTFAEAYLRRAEVRYLQKDDSGVLADCQQALVLALSDPKLYYYQGRSRYRLGYVQSAVAAFDDAIALDPGDARCYGWRGIAAQDLDDIDEAAQDFRRAAQLYRAQGNLVNARDMLKMLAALGPAGRSWPHRLLSQLLQGLLKVAQRLTQWPLSVLSMLLGRRMLGRWRSRSSVKRSSSRSAARPYSSSSSSSSAAPSGGVHDPATRGHQSIGNRRASSGPAAFRKPFQEKIYWAPGVSSRSTDTDKSLKHPSTGIKASLKLLSNPAGEMLPMYEQLPYGNRGLVGYALAVLANLCFVFGATQYLGDSSWLLTSCLWATGGLTFVAMVLVISVMRVWMRVEGLWSADIFILGTTMVPLGLLTVAIGVVPLLAQVVQALVVPWGSVVVMVGLLVIAFWAFSHAAIALHNGLYHIHRFSQQTAAWLSPVILGLGLSAGMGTGYFFARNLFSVAVTAVGA
ncbi:MAG: J domain-containing protein [Cyanobacteria bacterium J06629_19]